MPPDDDHPQRKRRRSLSACDDIDEQPSAKRRRAGFDNYPPEFWDALSKITLTRRALKEFDRRTAVEKSAPEVVGKRTEALISITFEASLPISNLLLSSEASS
ncbi:hypothetical protein BST61_g2016 [Cercospora zeina]